MRIVAFAGVYLGSAMVAVGVIAWALMHLEATVMLVVGGIAVIVIVRRTIAAGHRRRTVGDTDARLTPSAEPVTWTSGGTL
jgi:Flp pilus assembly protein TadB